MFIFKDGDSYAMIESPLHKEYGIKKEYELICKEDFITQ